MERLHLLQLIFALTITQVAPLSARSEYRAFELQIEDTEKGKSRTVFSTLDQLQYPRFHALEKNEVIRYVDSWMCFENMSQFRPICKKPDPQTASAPLSQ